MNDYTTLWTRKELKAYLLLYCANANYIEKEEEIDMIRAKVQEEQFESLRKEYDGDNDYQSIQKIQATIKRLGYSQVQIDDLIQETKDLFQADGIYDQVEKMLFYGLKKILE